MDIYSIIVGLHIIGTILGTGGATLAEFQLGRALKDKNISLDEHALMHVNYSLIRVGMAILFVSIIGMFWYHIGEGNKFILTSEKLWIKDIMFIIIVLNAVALQKRWVPLWLGASISFTSWWGATLLGIAGRLPYDFMTYLVGYIISIFVIAGILNIIHRMLSWR